MQSINIKEEPQFFDAIAIEKKWDNSNDNNNDNSFILQNLNSVGLNIKSEPYDSELPNESPTGIESKGIIKEEIDILDNDEIIETKLISINTENSDIHIDSKYCAVSDKNSIPLKEARVILTRIPTLKKSSLKKTDYTININRNEEHTRIASMCNHYCPKCDKIIDNPKAIHNSIKCGICRTALSLQCKKCDKQYTRPNAMYYHLMSRCYPRRRFNCSECNFETPMLISIQRHMRRMHSKVDESVECTTCHKKLKNLETLRRHARYCKKEGRLSCTICPYKSHFHKNFKNHMKSHEKFENLIKGSGDQRKMDDNDIQNFKISKNKKDLRQYELFTNFLRFCPQCDKTFQNTTISNSSRCHFCNNKLLMQCLNCDSKYKNLKEMKNHLYTKCTLKVYYNCSECNYQTVYKTSLKCHIIRFHTEIDPKEFHKCSKCNKAFRILEDFNKHLQRCGIDYYPYCCDRCSFRTKSKKSIRFHVQTHMKTSPVKGKKCTREIKKPKAYCSTCNAIRDTVQHSNLICMKCKNPMMFKCRECGTEVPTRKDLRLHESKEHGYVYHDCLNCNKIFLRLSNLKRHERVCQRGRSINISKNITSLL